MLVHQAYRYELDPDNATAAALRSHCEASRFAFNWGLSLVKERLEVRHQIRAACYRELLDDETTEALVATVTLPWTFYSLRGEWDRQKYEIAPWWKENSKFAYESGLEALATALSNFSASKRGLRAALAGFPNRKKYYSRRSCRFWSVKLKDDRHVKLPRIDAIRTKEQMSELAAKIADGSARVLNAAISELAGHWFVSFCCELERNDESFRPPEVGHCELLTSS